jgi:AcrR family transcriptional regulator
MARKVIEFTNPKIDTKTSRTIKDFRFKKTEQSIFEALSELLNECPMTVSLRPTELARRSRIAVSTFYRHYNNIDDVLKYHERNMMRRFRFMLQKVRETKPTLRQCIERVLYFIYNNRDFFSTAICQGNRCPLEAIFNALKPKICQTCHFPKNSERILLICFNEIYGLIEEWQKSSFEPERITGLVEDIEYLLKTAKVRLIAIVKKI